MNTTQIFDKVENGVITKQNIRRGTNGMGKLSDDSAYALKGLYPVVGTKPTITDTQRTSGPVHVWDDSANIINLVWTISDIPTEELAAKLQKEVTQATQKRLDDFAQTKTYDSILSACTYATSAIARLQAEGQYCVTARDNTWETLYTILAEVESGARPMPTGYGEIEPELPVLSWP